MSERRLHGFFHGRAHGLAIALIAACLATLSSGALRADPVTPFSAPGDGRVTVGHMALIEGASGAFSDKYTVEASFRDGGSAYFSVDYRNLGVGGSSFEVKSRYTDPEGNDFQTAEKLSSSEWSMTTGADFDLRMGRHRFHGTPREFTILAEGDGLRMELTFAVSPAAWRPGEGRAYFGSGTSRFIDMTVLAPRARVTGTVRTGETTREVTGSGYALHSYSNLAPHEVARRMIGFRTESGKLAIYMKDILPAERWSGDPLRWIYVARKRDVVFQSTSFELEAGDFKTDTAHPNQYRIPRVLRITGRDGDTEISITITAKRQRSRDDRLSDLSSMERAVASRFAKPVAYTYHATYALELKRGEEVETFEGRGIYELDHINR